MHRAIEVPWNSELLTQSQGFELWVWLSAVWACGEARSRRWPERTSSLERGQTGTKCVFIGAAMDTGKGNGLTTSTGRTDCVCSNDGQKSLWVVEGDSGHLLLECRGFGDKEQAQCWDDNAQTAIRGQEA